MAETANTREVSAVFRKIKTSNAKSVHPPNTIPCSTRPTISQLTARGEARLVEDAARVVAGAVEVAEVVDEGVSGMGIGVEVLAEGVSSRDRLANNGSQTVRRLSC